jgi:hypothetical protein
MMHGSRRVWMGEGSVDAQEWRNRGMGLKRRGMVGRFRPGADVGIVSS